MFVRLHEAKTTCVLCEHKLFWQLMILTLCFTQFNTRIYQNRNLAAFDLFSYVYIIVLKVLSIALSHIK